MWAGGRRGDKEKVLVVRCCEVRAMVQRVVHGDTVSDGGSGTGGCRVGVVSVVGGGDCDVSGS